MSLKLSQQATELAYSIFLIVLIPACMVGSTIWLTSQVKQNFDLELRRKANLANEVFGVSVANTLATNNPGQAAKLLQGFIEQARRGAPEIDQLTVATPAGSGFQTIAGSDTTKTGHPDTAIQTQLAWSKAQPVASLVATGEDQTREWLVATPVLGADDQPVAVTTMLVSLHSADEAMASTIRTSYIVLSIMLVVIIILLLNHFRFVEYAELFRKQKELGQMKDDFISIATHELKAPMTVIKGYLSMVLESKLPKEPQGMVKIAFDQTDRLGRLVGDLLDVSRLEQGKTKYNIAAIDLPATIAPMMGTFEVKAMDKKLKLRYKPAPGLPQVSSDPDRVSEIFTNLIDNAIKYSRAGTVTVEHSVTPTAVTTTVSDTGIGMTPEEQGRLFQRFYRAQNTDTKEIPGTGLGLWIIKQYIENMNGTIQVESEKGKGSNFIVTLPRANPAIPKTS